jgi:endoglucanase
MSYNVFAGATKALAASVALATLLGSAHVYASTTSVTGTSAVTVSHATDINNFTNTDWLNGVWRKSAGFSIPANAANQAAFKVGTQVRLADGQVRKVTVAQTVGSNLSIFLDGAAVNGSVVGAPNKLSVVTAGTTSTTTSTATAAPATSTSAATTTSTSGSVIATSLVNNFTNTDWVNGIWRRAAGFSTQSTAANQSAFKVGAQVRLADGQVRRITSAQVVGSNMSIMLDGAVLNGSLGYPNKVSVVSGTTTAAPVTTAPSTAPAPVPSPAPSTDSGTVTTGLNGFTNTDWLNGIWRRSAGFSIPATSANQAAFKVGAQVRLADGQVRRITTSQLVGSNMSIMLDGATIDGNVLGHPKTVSVISASSTATAPAPAPAPAPVATAPSNGYSNGPVRLVGVNLSAAGFGPSVVPGTYGQHYYYPDESYYKKYADLGMNLVRLPFLWERIQPQANGGLNAAELARLKQSLDFAQKHGVKVILDMHNYYRYFSKLIGTPEVPISSFAEVWRKIAVEVVKHPAVDGYGLMNEPYNTNGLWPQAAEAAGRAIRTVDPTRWIYIAGDSYSNSLHWVAYNKTLINSPWMREPQNNLVYEAHMYLDHNMSGLYQDRSETFAPNLGVERVRPFVEWLKTHKLRGYIGEHGVPDFAPSGMVAMDNLLTYLRQNCIPMTYWAAGPWWGEYVLSLDTKSGSYRPQLPVLKKHAAAAHSCSTIGPIH